MNRKLIKDLMDAIKASDRKKTSGYDTSAVVRRIEDGTAWVHIPGGVDETPVKLTINASVGDTVQVRVSGGRAFLVGNRTAPPTDDTTAIKATYVAKNAQETAVEAKSEASEAWHYAGTAKEAAESAQDSADSAAEAAIEAWNHADDAHQAAISANNSANNALVQLSVVEDVAGTLRWISEHGSFVPTTDTTVIEGSVYFIYENGDYIPIANPDPSANPSQEGWYVLDVTESQAKYIMAHLAVTSAGLWVLPVNQLAEHPLVDSDGDQIIDSDNNPIVDFSEDPQHASGYKVLLSGTGMTVYNDEGASVAFYGETTRIGKEYDYNVHITSNEVQIRDGTTVLAKYGATTKFYEPDGVTEAAEIGANGMHVKEGRIGSFNIDGNGWLKTIDGNTWLKDGLQVESTISNVPYIARYFPNEVYLAKNAGSTSGSIVDIIPTEVRVTANDGNKESKLSAHRLDIYGDESANIVTRVALSNRSEGIELQLAVSGNRGVYDSTNDTWVLYKRPTDASSYPNCTFVRGDEVILQNEEDTSEFIRYLCNSNGTNCLIPSVNNKIHLGLPSYKWANIHATSSDIGSDLKTKEVIENFDWKVDEFIKGLKPIAYRLLDENGNQTKRIKMGFGAQDVAQLSKDIQLGDMSLYNAVIAEKDENGNINERPYHGEEIDDNKLVWSLRYYEFIAPMVLEIQQLMNRVKELEDRLYG